MTPKGEKKKTVWVLDLSLPDVSLNELLRHGARIARKYAMLPPPPDEEEAPEDDEPDEVLAGETYQHGSTDAPARVIPDAVERSAPPTAPAKPPKAKQTAPIDAVKANAQEKAVNSLDDLASYEPANVGELYNAGGLTSG